VPPRKLVAQVRDLARGGLPPYLTLPAAHFGKPACRLGLASRGATTLTPDDVRLALERGVNFLNWPGEADTPGGPDAVSEVVRSLGGERERIIVCVQFGSRTAKEAAGELRSILTALGTNYVDVLTLYYVERAEEWSELCAPEGALSYLHSARCDGVVRRLGVTSHQRQLAAVMAESGLLDLLMIRYNAAHRGAERDIFPTTDRLHMPVIAYTALRWGALLGSTPDDSPGFVPPPAAAWYRFVLQSSSVAVTLAAPANPGELEEALKVLSASTPLTNSEYQILVEHGERVRRHAGRFP
jgi:predicted aldo/keto reductase-like oxidoreductase